MLLFLEILCAVLLGGVVVPLIVNWLYDRISRR